jgi:transcriptional regulator with XRE-family HTH domain
MSRFAVPGENLRVRRVQARLTLAEVARESGMAPGRLCNYENGVHDPDERSMKRVSDAIDRLARSARTIRKGGNRLWLRPKGGTGKVKVFRMPF